MEEMISKQEEQNKRRGMIFSVIMHTVLLAIFLLPLLTFPDPPPGQEGVLVNLGADFGQGEENAPEPEYNEPVEEAVEDPVEEQVEEVEEQPTETEPTPEPEVIRTEEPDAVAIQKAKEEAKKKQEAIDEQKRKDEEARKKAEEEAEKKRLEEEYNKKKKKFSGAFGGGEGSGKGNTGQAGNQGDENGDPNASNLEGVSTGSGQVGGGLGSRGVSSRPKVSNPTNKTGVVVMKVCVNSSGQVISADYTQAGSTTTDSKLISIAKSAAKKWKFSKGTVDRQCGTISYTFKTQ